jgi:hypothetical protein
MKSSPQKPTYRLELTAMPGNAEPVAALQRLLKAARRAYQFRCVRVEEVKPADKAKS